MHIRWIYIISKYISYRDIAKSFIHFTKYWFFFY